MMISFGSWAFLTGAYARTPIPLDRTIAGLSEAGYDGIELSGLRPHAALEDYATPGARRELASSLEDHGLEISGYAADFSATNPILDGNRENYLELFRRAVDFRADVGSPSIRVDSASAPGSIAGLHYREACDRLAAVWAEAAGIAGRARVRMVWEFEPRCLFNKPSEILALHRSVDHTNFRLLFDTAHAYNPRMDC